MNVAELYKQTAQLGFEDSLDDSDRFYYAANRALLQVCKIRPAVGYYLINHKPLENLVVNATFSPVEKIDDLIYEASTLSHIISRQTETAFYTSSCIMQVRTSGILFRRKH